MSNKQALTLIGSCFALPALLGLVVHVADRRIMAEYTPRESPRTYVVRRGDTPWQIVKAHYGEEVDPRVVLEAIKQANRLRDIGLIWPGQRLLLPEVR